MSNIQLSKNKLQYTQKYKNKTQNMKSPSEHACSFLTANVMSKIHSDLTRIDLGSTSFRHAPTITNNHINVEAKQDKLF